MLNEKVLQISWKMFVLRIVTNNIDFKKNNSVNINEWQIDFLLLNLSSNGYKLFSFLL